MADNKSRDDKFIHKDEEYEINYEISKYPNKYSHIVEEEIENGDYQTHEELEEKLKNRGVNKK